MIARISWFLRYGRHLQHYSPSRWRPEVSEGSSGSWSPIHGTWTFSILSELYQAKPGRCKAWWIALKVHCLVKTDKGSAPSFLFMYQFLGFDDLVRINRVWLHKDRKLSDFASNTRLVLKAVWLLKQWLSWLSDQVPLKGTVFLLLEKAFDTNIMNSVSTGKNSIT